LSDELIQDLARMSKDPYRFVLWAFPWGEEGTELALSVGPDDWQVRLLQQVRDGLLTPNEAIQIATASGHGVGKSAIVGWLTLWAFSTFPGTRGVITANTETQLKTKTWVELAKWFRLFIARDLFDLAATVLRSRDPELENEWRIDQVPWSERTVESFAGLHNQGKRILVIFDEASAIPDMIWETTEGALTDKDTEILWFVFGNPTRTTGRFRECFPGGKHNATWKFHRVDSREVRISNKDQIAKWIAAYGDDSDFVRVRVKGEFPRVGAMEFISRDAAVEASLREIPDVHRFEPLVVGVDVARFGDDETVICVRKGRDARSFPAIRLRGADTMQVAGKVVEVVAQYRADAVFVDGGGVGGGVVDRLRQLRANVIEVQFGAKADNLNADEPNVAYANKRAEIWGAMRAWLKTGAIPEDQDIIEQLSNPLYGFNASNAIQLERKEDMKKRGLASPDYGDALACTFAYPVMANIGAGSAWPRNPGPAMADCEYDPMEAA
jgi:hypothetical protein